MCIFICIYICHIICVYMKTLFFKGVFFSPFPLSLIFFKNKGVGEGGGILPKEGRT